MSFAVSALSRKPTGAAPRAAPSHRTSGGIRPKPRTCAVVFATPKTADGFIATSATEEGSAFLGRRSVILTMTAAVIGAPSLLFPRNAAADEIDIEAVKKTIEHDFVEGQYYVTGNLTKSAFTEDCIFIDPTTNVQGVERYTTAVAALFDAQTSKAELISLQVEDPRTILLTWRLQGVLRLGGLSIKPYTGTTRYSINDDGLIYRHFETWDISAVDAFVSCFFPSFGAPPAPPVEELRKSA